MNNLTSMLLNKKKKMGKQLLSHRYNLLPLLRSRPGGVQRELIVKDLPTANVAKDIKSGNNNLLILRFRTIIGVNQLNVKEKKLTELRQMAIQIMISKH
jgi:hypothetical protein